MGQIYVEGDAGAENTAFYHISYSIIAVAVFVAVGSSMIRSGDGRKIDMMLKPEIIHMIMLL